MRAIHAMRHNGNSVGLCLGLCLHPFYRHLPADGALFDLGMDGIASPTMSMIAGIAARIASAPVPVMAHNASPAALGTLTTSPCMVFIANLAALSALTCVPRMHSYVAK